MIADINAYGGVWFRCTNPECRFGAGDLIELCSVLFDISPSAAIQRLIQVTGASHLTSVFTPDQLQLYDDYIDYQNGIKQFWLEARSIQRILKKLPHAAKKMQNSRLWPGIWEWQARVGRIAGVADKQTINMALVPFGKNKTSSKIIPKGFGNDMLTMAWEDAPGRIQSFEFISLSGDHAGESIFHRLGTSAITDDGLAMLHTLRQREDVVYALRDSCAAIRLQHNHLLHNDAPIPMVVYRDSSLPATWAYVRAHAVVFWEAVLSWRTFAVARSVPNACIASVIATEETLLQWQTRSDRFLRHLRNLAAPWGEALKIALLNISHAEVCEWVANLQLTPQDWERIFETATAEERATLNRFILTSPGLRTYVVFGGHRIVAGDDTWWYGSDSPKAQDELLTDAPMRIHTILHHAETGKTVMCGEILFQKKSVAFEVDEQKLREDPVQFIRDKVLSQGLGYPTINSRGLGKAALVDVALQFHKPEVVVDHGRVGWDATQARFVLPTLLIDRYGIRSSTNTRMSPEMVPGYYIKHVDAEPSLASLCPEISDTQAAFWAAFAAVMHNALHAAAGSKPSGIAVVGTKLSMGGAVYRKIVDTMHLLPYSLKKADDVSELNLLEDLHDLPVAVEQDHTKSEVFTSWVESTNRRNGLILVQMKTAMTLGMFPGWSFVVCPKTEATALPEILDGVFVRLVQHLLSGEYRDGFGSPQQCLRAIRHWMVSAKPVKAQLKIIDIVFQRAEQMLMIGSPLGEIPKQERLFALLFRMLDDQVIQAAAPAAPTRMGSPIVVDLDRELVWVDMSRVLTALRKMGAPAPSTASDWTDCVETSADASSSDVTDLERARLQGLPIDLGFWNKQFQRWKGAQKLALDECELPMSRSNP